MVVQGKPSRSIQISLSATFRVTYINFLPHSDALFEFCQAVLETVDTLLVKVCLPVQVFSAHGHSLKKFILVETL